MFNISEELKKLPDKSGVYIMKDENDTVIYVGKAKVLKNRVRQYFQNSASHSAKVKSMVSHICEFEYIVTDTEVEALILENNLIKKYEPKYNIMLRDDKTYPYIKVTVNEDFPRVFITRRLLKDKAKYFGPYTNLTSLNENIALLHEIFPIRSCSRQLPKDIGRQRACLNYHIGKCKAPCIKGGVSKEEYNAMIDKVLEILSGKYESTKKMLEGKMYEYSENMEYEKAAVMRDKIAALGKLGQRQVMENLGSLDSDVIGVAKGIQEAVVQIFFIRNGKITGREHFLIKDVYNTAHSEILSGFVKQFYSGTAMIPKEISVSWKIDDDETISMYLSELKGQRVTLSCPQKGEKRSLTELADKNALIMLTQFGEEMKREQSRTIGALKQISEKTGINDINRIESYDISNTNGFESVGSMVVFEGGKPKRSDYRKFRIKTVAGPDDYASLEEVLTRRFKRYIDGDAAFSRLPDVIFMDGGKGQIQSAKNVLSRLNLNVDVCGMVKDDYHRTRGLIYNGKQIYFDTHSEAFKLITRIQDEVHRFAIEYHRRLREKRQIHSVLEDIKGIGDIRRKALMKHFGDIEKIKNASIDELEAVDKMNRKSAESVYSFFNPQKEDIQSSKNE